MTGVVLLTAANLHVVVLKALPRGESPTSNLRPKNRFNGDGGVKGASQRQVADRELGPEQTRRQWLVRTSQRQVTRADLAAEQIAWESRRA